MNDALERMRWIEEQIRELANDLDWLDDDHSAGIDGLDWPADAVGRGGRDEEA